MPFPRIFLSVVIVTASIGVNLTAVAQTSPYADANPSEQNYQREKAQQEKTGTNPNAGLNTGAVYYNNAPQKVEKPCVPRPKPSTSAKTDGNRSTGVQKGPTLPYDDTYCPVPVDIDAIIAKAKKAEADRAARQSAEASATSSSDNCSAMITDDDMARAFINRAENAHHAGDISEMECLGNSLNKANYIRGLVVLGVVALERKQGNLAFHYFLDAAKQGDGFGAYWSAYCYANWIGTAYDFEEWQRWEIKAQSDPEVRSILGPPEDPGADDRAAQAQKYNELSSGSGFGFACDPRSKQCVSRSRAPAGYHQPH